MANTELTSSRRAWGTLPAGVFWTRMHSWIVQRPAFMPLGGLIVVYLVLSLGFSAGVPIYEAPDEPGHFEFVIHLRNEKSLPRQNLERRNYGHHPPLYYVLAAFASLPAPVPADLNDTTSLPILNPNFDWSEQIGPGIAHHGSAETFPYRGAALAFHLARLVSVSAGLATVLLTYAISRMLFPNRRELSALVTVLVAFNPQFLFVSSAVNNDALLIAACTGLLWQLLRTLAAPANLRHWLYLGVWAAAAMLTKATALVAIGVVMGSWLVYAVEYPPRRRWRIRPAFLKGGLIFGATFGLLAGWWFVRNMILYGDPMGWAVYRQIWDVTRITVPFTTEELLYRLELQFHSFWGLFGWMNVYLPDWIYSIIGGVLIASLVGWLVAWRKGDLRALTSSQRRGLLIFAAYIVLQGGFIFYQNTQHDQSFAQGRYLFPAIAPMMTFVALGLAGLARPRGTRIMPGVVGVALAALSIYALLWVIVPSYSRVAQPKLAMLTLDQRTEFTFGDMLMLRGYNQHITLEGETATLELELYWQAQARPDFDYTVFVHALDRTGNVLAQHDYVPGSRVSYAPLRWQVGDIIADIWRMDLPARQWQEGVQLHVGVYNWETGERLRKPDGADYIVLREMP